MSDMSRERRIAWLARLGLVTLGVLGRTWRVRYVNNELVRREHAAGRRVIHVLWHGQLFPLLWLLRDRPLAVVISEHTDGEIIARAAQALGYRPVRGSTSRGAARALLGAAREVDAGYDLAITPDGPRGPAKSVAPGAVIIAQRTGAPLMPVAVWASRAWRLNTWDGFLIPKPFARVHVAYGPPMVIDSDSARKAVEASDAVRAGIDGAIAIAEAGHVPA